MKFLDFAKHFDSEEACEKYLKETREKEGIKCSRCGCSASSGTSAISLSGR